MCNHEIFNYLSITSLVLTPEPAILLIKQIKAFVYRLNLIKELTNMTICYLLGTFIMYLLMLNKFEWLLYLELSFHYSAKKITFIFETLDRKL